MCAASPPTNVEFRRFRRISTSASDCPRGRDYLIALRQKSKYADAPETASRIAHIGARLIRTALTGNIWIPNGVNNGFEYTSALPGMDDLTRQCGSEQRWINATSQLRANLWRPVAPPLTHVKNVLMLNRTVSVAFGPGSARLRLSAS
ncbi:hypothetical protein Bxe_B1531 [Paraburkholderia xenovorans LB400]|uniref:Uncharacterized protein n=1 Tax=Paraburkholderia xenovorans (strain LB400) TaxID=266265 RepID=Q13NA6_PARXL|nr:hypothetical protein Bxe_B1531 [Paraburkholderia xenovorans LB400]